MAEAGQTPHELRTRLDVDSVDQHGDRQILERSGPDVGLTQRAQRLARVDRRDAAQFEQHPDPVESKEVTPLQSQRVVPHHVGGHPGGGRRGHECADAGSGVERRTDSSFGEGLKDADVGESLQAAAAQDHCDTDAHNRVKKSVVMIGGAPMSLTLRSWPWRPKMP